MESTAFVRAMDNPDIPLKEKAALLRKCVISIFIASAL